MAWRIKITNESHVGSPWVGIFETEAEADAWTQDQKVLSGRDDLSAVYVKTNLDIDPEWQAQLEDFNIRQKGRDIRSCCAEVHEYIAGLNEVRQLSVEGVQTMQTTFTPIMSLLIALRPKTAKTAIQAIVPDDILVTQFTKDRVLEIFAKYGM
jgi:hypothetical protein